MNFPLNKQAFFVAWSALMMMGCMGQPSSSQTASRTSSNRNKRPFWGKPVRICHTGRSQSASCTSAALTSKTPPNSGACWVTTDGRLACPLPIISRAQARIRVVFPAPGGPASAKTCPPCARISRYFSRIRLNNFLRGTCSGGKSSLARKRQRGDDFLRRIGHANRKCGTMTA